MNNSTRLVILFFTLFFSTAPGIISDACAQPDTIPRQIQKTPVWLTPGISVIVQGLDSVLIEPYNGGIGFSTDRGQTFELRDTGANAGTEICFARSGSIWQIAPSGAVEFSTSAGLSWNMPLSSQNPGKGVWADGTSRDGKLFWFSTSKHVVTTRTNGSSWDTLPFANNPGNSVLEWLDADHAARLIANSAVLITGDGGLTWDSVVTKDSSAALIIKMGTDIAYLAPGVLAVLTGFGTLYISSDTGRSWTFHGNVDEIWNIILIRNNLWYGSASAFTSSSGALFRSTDTGATWNPVHYTCPNGPSMLAFGDSVHGIALGTAETDDVGYTWDCLDTALYMNPVPVTNTQTIFPSGFDASSYYGLAKRYGGTYICLTTDRGDTWSALLPSPVGASFLPVGHRLFFGYQGRVTWTDDYGTTFDTLSFYYDGINGYIKRTPDGTLWAGNEVKLFVSMDDGTTWFDRSDSLPYRWDSVQLTYTLTPVDSITGFAKTSSGGIFRTTDAGLTWRSDSSASSAMQIPTFVLDSRHWFYSPGYRSVQYTSDAGATWDTLKLPPTNGYVGNLFAVDSERWLLDGLYTTSAGASWLPIPGWDNGYHVEFTVMDSSTAFGGQLWRLDMPWYVKPQERVTSIPAAEQPTATASPNPMGKFTILSFTTATEGEVNIEVFDVLGNKVTNGFSGTLGTGNHTEIISLATLPSGIYYARIQTESGIQTIKVVKE